MITDVNLRGGFEQYPFKHSFCWFVTDRQITTQLSDSLYTYMHSLIRFMNHGTLPFTGRDAEREQILSFCRTTGSSGGLRSLAVVAPAGMGKTRLIDEVVDELADRVLAIRIRLYADSSLALFSMIAEVLERSGRKVEGGPGGGPIIRELREAARLRPVILVIEDLHLLSGEPVGDLVRLLEGIAGS